MNPKRKLLICLLGNTALLAIIIAATIILNDGGMYFRFGPSPDLTIVSTRIDTTSKYIGLLVLIAFLNGVSVLVEEFGMPVLGFNVYNPDKTHITDFSKGELNFYANAMYFTSAIRGVLMTVVSISQIDIAMFSVIVREITAIFTVRALLNEKTFGYAPVSTEETVEIQVITQS